MASQRSAFAFLREKLLLVFRPALSASLLVTGGYVCYMDYFRYPRMIRTYERGNILPPFKENNFEVHYCPRPAVESRLREILTPSFSNEYYLVNGEIGSGKTRTLIHLTRDMVASRGSRGEGAPIYVSCAQGRSFSDALADAVNFRFDEHISFRSFIDYMLKVKAFPERDGHNKLLRVLDAIEESAFRYTQLHGRPVVLVLDNTSRLDEQLPKALRKLQEKAKLWADTNTVKVVFVTAEDHTEFVLQATRSSWSRSATPLTVGDLGEEEAVRFLTAPGVLECDSPTPEERVMTADSAREIYAQVGGRMLHLVGFKHAHGNRVPVDRTLRKLKDKEREKLLQVAGHPSPWRAMQLLKDSKGMACDVATFVRKTSKEDLLTLTKAHIIKVERVSEGIDVKFESKLTESVIVEFYDAHNKK